MIELSLLAGIWFAIGIYLLLEVSSARILFGIIFLSHAVNLAFFISGGLVRGRALLVNPDGPNSLATMADPLPQALILTAIVISFALIFYIAILARQISIVSTAKYIDAERKYKK